MLKQGFRYICTYAVNILLLHYENVIRMLYEHKGLCTRQGWELQPKGLRWRKGLCSIITDHSISAVCKGIRVSSAYREHNSTETVLVKLISDILINMDKRLITPLVAIDLSAAFDTVDHTVLINVLQNVFGLRGTALNWAKNYLSGRHTKVQINKSLSREVNLQFSVPQGSCAGPVFYNIYTSTLLSEINRYQTQILGYADDHTLYDSFQADSRLGEQTCVSNLEKCLADIQTWMTKNRLKMNNEKTECIMFGNKVQLDKCITTSITVNDAEIVLQNKIDYLGVPLDETLSMKSFIVKKCKVAAFNLHNIRKIRNCLSQKAAKQIVISLVISHLDYANAILINLPAKTIYPLQRIQNQAAKLILMHNCSDSSADALKELHWLPVKWRIVFKVLCLAFKCVHNQAPDYLQEMFVKSDSNYYCLRSHDKQRFQVPPTQKVNFGDRAFAVDAPKRWNDLPLDLQNCTDFLSFKRKLKTHLFKYAFV